MAIAVQTNAVRYIDVDAGDVIDVSMHLDEEEHIKVLYGNASLVAERGTDYTVALQPDSFNSFQITVGASLKAKIDALIAGDADEENAITIRRTLPLQTESTPANVRYTKFTSQEFDRIIMMMQQIQEQLDRAVQQPPINVGESGESIYVFPGTPGALAQYDDAGNVVPGPIVNDVATVAGIAEQIATLSTVRDQIAVLVDYTAALAALGPRAVHIEALGIRTAMIDALYALTDEIEALYLVREDIASLGPVALSVASLETIKAQIVSLEAIKAELVALYNIRDDITAVSDIANNVTAVAAIGPNVTTVAGIAGGVQDVADNLPLIQEAVDSLPSLASKVSKTGDTMTGPLILSGAALPNGAVAGSVLTIPNGVEAVTVDGVSDIWDIHPVRPRGARLSVVFLSARKVGQGSSLYLRGAPELRAYPGEAFEFVSDGALWILVSGGTYDNANWRNDGRATPMPVAPSQARELVNPAMFRSFQWVDMKAARPANQQWVNDTGYTIFLNIHIFGAATPEYVDVLDPPDPGVWKRMMAVATATAGTATQGGLCIPIRPGQYYRRTGGPGTVNWWMEFRPA